MRRFVRTFAACLLLLLAAPACAQQPPAKPQDADPALWVVKDRDTTIYLFGTIHVLKPGLSWFDEAVRAAFDKSDQVMLELVTPDSATMQGLVVKYGLAPEGTPPLTRRLPAREQIAYVKELTALGQSPDAFDRMKPWVAAVNLAVLPLTRLGYDPDQAPEAVITRAAATAHKPLGGLETAEQQIGYFGTLPDAVQLRFLRASIDELPGLQREFATMVSDWAHGHPERLAALLNKDMDATPEIKRVLLIERNRRWAQWIKGRMAKPGTVFIAVGAGHLAGPQSVQAELARLGLRAQRVAY